MLTVYLEDGGPGAIGMLRRPGPFVGTALEFSVMEPLPPMAAFHPEEKLEPVALKRFRISLRDRPLPGGGSHTVGVVDLDTAHELFDLDDFDPI
jgi:hypothetical protein